MKGGFVWKGHTRNSAVAEVFLLRIFLLRLFPAATIPTPTLSAAGPSTLRFEHLSGPEQQPSRRGTRRARRNRLTLLNRRSRFAIANRDQLITRCSISIFDGIQSRDAFYLARLAAPSQSSLLTNELPPRDAILDHPFLRTTAFRSRQLLLARTGVARPRARAPFALALNERDSSSPSPPQPDQLLLSHPSLASFPKPRTRKSLPDRLGNGFPAPVPEVLAGRTISRGARTARKSSLCAQGCC